MEWILKLILPTAVSMFGTWLKNKNATQDELSVYQAFLKLSQSKGLISVTLKEDYDQQGPKRES